MRSISLFGACEDRFVCVLTILLICSAPSTCAAVGSISGSFTSLVATGPNGYASAGIQIQGPDFSLTSSQDCNSFVNFTTNRPNSASFNPTISVYETSLHVCPLTSMYLVYQGQAYTNVNYTLSFVGRPVTVPNTAAQQLFAGTVGGTASGVAFTMTGLVSVYSDPSNSEPALFTIPISGTGIYSAYGEEQTGAGPFAAVSYQFFPVPPGVTLDTTTRGAWGTATTGIYGNLQDGSYGGEGYLIANGASFQPSYAAVSISNADIYTWASTTNDPRALQNGRGAAPSGIASAYTSRSFDFNVYFTDSYLHRVSLYALDWDMAGRSETITISNADTGTVLDTETLTNFQNGEYISFNLSGNVKITVTSTGVANAAVSGIFFGPGGAIDTYAGPLYLNPIFFQAPDSATQGAWTGIHGLNGYLIAGGAPSGFTSGSVEPVGATTYIWTPQTADPRALQTAPGSGSRIASAFTQYPFTGFSFNIYGAPSTVSLYLLDWDNAGRSETITIKDLSTGSILNQQTFSNFQNGVYATFFPLGDVIVQIQPVGSASAAVSGIFFN